MQGFYIIRYITAAVYTTWVHGALGLRVPRSVPVRFPTQGSFYWVPIKLFPSIRVSFFGWLEVPVRVERALQQGLPGSWDYSKFNPSTVNLTSNFLGLAVHGTSTLLSTTQRVQVSLRYILIGFFWGGLSIYHNDTWTLWATEHEGRRVAAGNAATGRPRTAARGLGFINL